MRLALTLLCFLLSASVAGAASCAFQAGAKIDPAADLFILAEGDSITAGVGSSDGIGSYVERSAGLIKSSRQIAIKAVTQSVLGWPGSSGPPNSLYARMNGDNALLPKDKKGRVYVLTLLIGRNDLVGYYGALDQYLTMLSQYVDRMKQAGWDKVIIGTLLPSDWPPFNAVRASFNQRVLAPCWAVEHGIDAIADFAALDTMGPDGAAGDKTLFVDGTHPTDLGYALMAPVYAEALNALRR